MSQSSTCLHLCRYLSSILSRQSSAHTISELIESLSAIDSWVQNFLTNCNLNTSLMIPVTYFVDSDTGGHVMIPMQGMAAIQY
jgi:hypothetical protein